MMLAKPELYYPGKFAQSVKYDTREIKLDIENWLYEKVGGVVQSGPFRGMWLPKEKGWPDTYLAPLLLGCYEEELHGTIDHTVQRLRALDRQPHVVVVGAAEGYYAIGLKRLLPNAIVYAIDKEDECIRIMLEAAKVNKVEIIVGEAIDTTFAKADFILMDVEGAEVIYLQPDKFPHLMATHMLVEMHNFQGQKSDQIILDRFRSSHRITMYTEGPRDPNRHLSDLCGMVGDYRWLAVSEGRPALMGWFHMIPRGWDMP